MAEVGQVGRRDVGCFAAEVEKGRGEKDICILGKMRERERGRQRGTWYGDGG
jgi:hypothetical protein